MADQDSISSDVIYEYDVFLSFSDRTKEETPEGSPDSGVRTQDGTRYGFTDQLHKALIRKGIKIYRVDENQRSGGEEISADILEKIEKSRISMVVLSTNYASSTWCLDELAKIVECLDKKKMHVSTIFYHVEPADPRHQLNSYKEAMIQHEKIHGKDSVKVETWRSALKRVCDLSGVTVKGQEYDYKLINKIVEDAYSKLPPLSLQNNSLVELQSWYEQMNPLIIDIESKNTAVCMLGIYGDKGIGKTTFVLGLYNKIKDQFKAAIFLGGVSEKSNNNPIIDLEELQKTLLRGLGVKTSNRFKASSEIKSKLRMKKVLVVLDDVDKIGQLKSLAGGLDWFGSGSRIIITTRDATVLDNHTVPIKKYRMEGVNSDDAVKLFCRYAFKMSKSEENYEHILSRVVSYAKGSPLALRVIGSSLNSLSAEEREMELNNIENDPSYFSYLVDSFLPKENKV